MAKMNEQLRETLQHLVNSDGKLIITEEMPDDIKDALNYFNENNIDIFNTDFDVDSNVINNGEPIAEAAVSDDEFNEQISETESNVNLDSEASEDVQSLGNFL